MKILQIANMGLKFMIGRRYKMSKVLNLDFDGTIVDFRFPSIGEPKNGVKEALQEIKGMGYYIRIFSCRTSEEVFKYSIERQQQVRVMERYLDEHEIPYDEILNINKPLGIIIDDNAIGYRGDWEKTLKEFKELK